jgi:flagellar biogenesis protein FliO
VGTETGDYLRLMLVLAGVLLLAYAALRYLLPRLTGVTRGASGPIKVVARLGIEPRKNLYIVQAGSEFLLIGTSENQMQRLASLDGASLDLNVPSNGVKSGAGGEFSRLVASLRRPKGD